MKNNIDTIIKATTFGMFALGTIMGGIVLGTICFVGTIVVWLFLYQYVELWFYNQTLKRYARKKNNIYVYSEHPHDKTVYLRAKAHRKLLQESGNKLDVNVYEIYYRDAVNPDESWEQYEYRRDEFIRNDRYNRHQHLNSAQRSWYVRHMLEQTEA